MALDNFFFKKLVAHEIYAAKPIQVYPVAALMNMVTTSTDNATRGVRFLSNMPHPNGGYYFLYTPTFTFSVAQNVTTAVENGVCTVTGVYTVTNNGNADFTITDCYLYDTFTSPESNSTGCWYIDHTVLDNPVTIPANGGVGQITYEIKFTYA